MKKRIFIFFVIFIIGAWPFFLVMYAGTVASNHNCTLHEGFVNPCIVNGKDIGKELYSMGVMGWLMLVTMPIAFFCYLFWIIVEIVLYFKRKKSRINQIQSAAS